MVMGDSEKPRSDSGTWEPETSGERIISKMENGEPYSSGEVAEMMDIPRRTAHYRLNKLAEDGEIRKKKLGHRSVVWIRPADEEN